jgi:ABC-type Fe3+-hydroxamate transport system substrate-binding protein
MKSEILNYLCRLSEMFKMSIPDLAWFLRATEGEIRTVISDLNLVAPSLPRPPPFKKESASNVYHFYTFTPYFVWRDEIIVIAQILGKTKLRAGRDFEERMKPILAMHAEFEAAVKTSMK